MITPQKINCDQAKKYNQSQVEANISDEEEKQRRGRSRK
jgi:hypothetical protein